MFGDLNFTTITIIIISLVLSVGLHEAMHAWTAHKLGDPTASELGRVTLNPLAHIDFLTTLLLPLGLILVGLPPFFVAKPVPFRPDLVRYGDYGAALVGIAGPLTNLALAAGGSLVLHLNLFDMNSLGTDALLIFMQINVALFVFNMIPFPPLDGSRLLYAFAPQFLRRIMEQIEALGFFVILLFVLVIYQFIAPWVLDIMNGVLQILLW